MVSTQSLMIGSVLRGRIPPLNNRWVLERLGGWISLLSHLKRNHNTVHLEAETLRRVWLAALPDHTCLLYVYFTTGMKDGRCEVAVGVNLNNVVSNSPVIHGADVLIVQSHGITRERERERGERKVTVFSPWLLHYLNWHNEQHKNIRTRVPVEYPKKKTSTYLQNTGDLGGEDKDLTVIASASSLCDITEGRSLATKLRT